MATGILLIITMGVLYAILSPLFTRRMAWIEPGEDEDGWHNELELKKNMNLRALNDIRFEFASGKINRDDYLELRDHYRLKVAEVYSEIEKLEQEESGPLSTEFQPQEIENGSEKVAADEENRDELTGLDEKADDELTLPTPNRPKYRKVIKHRAGRRTIRYIEEEDMDEQDRDNAYHEDQYMYPERDFKKPFLVVTSLLVLLITGLTTYTMGKRSSTQGSYQMNRNASAVLPGERTSGTGGDVSDPASSIVGLDHAINYLKENPWNVQAHLIVGEYFADSGEISNAMEHYQNAAQYEPGSVRVLKRLGDAYHTLGDKERAIEHLNASLAEDPDDIESMYHMGLIYSEKGNKEKAIGYFKKIMSSDPDGQLAPMVREELVRLGIEDGQAG